VNGALAEAIPPLLQLLLLPLFPKAGRLELKGECSCGSSSSSSSKTRPKNLDRRQHPTHSKLQCGLELLLRE
jgi:hypothetical protein